MLIILIIFQFFFISQSLFRKEKLYSPIFVFNSWWFLITFFSMFGFFGLFVPGTKVYNIILIGMFGYNLTYLFLELINSKRIIKKTKSERKFIKNRFMLLQTIAFIYLFFSSLKTFIMIRNGYDYSQIRYDYFQLNGYETSNLVSVYFRTYILQAIVFLGIIISGFELFKKNRNKLIIYVSIINVLMLIFINSGRTIIFQLVLVILFSYLLRPKNNKITKKIKFMTFSMASFFMFLTVFITNLRNYKDESAILATTRTIVTYFLGSLTFLEYNINEFLKTGESYLYGRGFLGGIIDPFINVVNILGFENIRSSGEIINEITGKFSYVGTTTYYNAFSTMFFVFFVDFGYIGVFICTSFFAFLSYFIYLGYNKSEDNYSKGLLIIILYGTIYSSFRWIFLFPWVIILIILLKFCFKKSKKGKLLNE
ncbi:O-antigen polymerase [Carnobacterium maltaromaticum]